MKLAMHGRHCKSPEVISAPCTPAKGSRKDKFFHRNFDPG